MCSYHFSSVGVVEWPPFGKWLLSQLIICYICILTICNLVISHFGYEGWIWDLIAPVPGLYILLTFTHSCHLDEPILLFRVASHQRKTMKTSLRTEKSKDVVRTWSK